MVIQERAKLLKPLAKELGLIQKKDIAYSLIGNGKYYAALCLNLAHVRNPLEVKVYNIIKCLFMPLPSFAWDVIQRVVLSSKAYCDSNGYHYAPTSWDKSDFERHSGYIIEQYQKNRDKFASLDDILELYINNSSENVYNSIRVTGAEVNRVFETACVALAAGNYEEARRWLLKEVEHGNRFHPEYADYSRLMLGYIDSSDYAAIDTMLTGWQDEVVTRLKIKL